MTAPIRIVIADDHRILREGLRRMLGDYPDLEIVGEATNGDEVPVVLDATHADVLLLDVGMPGHGFLSTLEKLRSEHPDTSVIILSAYAEEEYAVMALRAGARGYVTKERSPEELLAAIRRVSRGGRYITQTLAEQLAAEIAAHPAGPPRMPSLSERERQVLQFLGQGLTVKEIGARLEVSPKTVSTYRLRLLEKLQLRTTADLIRYAVEHDLIGG